MATIANEQLMYLQARAAQADELEAQNAAKERRLKAMRRRLDKALENPTVRMAGNVGAAVVAAGSAGYLESLVGDRQINGYDVGPMITPGLGLLFGGMALSNAGGEQYNDFLTSAASGLLAASAHSFMKGRSGRTAASTPTQAAAGMAYIDEFGVPVPAAAGYLPPHAHHPPRTALSLPPPAAGAGHTDREMADAFAFMREGLVGAAPHG